MISFRTIKSNGKPAAQAARELREYHENSDSVASAREYYEHGSIGGKWAGTLAAELGLEGVADGDDVEAVLQRIHPKTGEKLAQRVQVDERLGFDFTFSAPKSVSVMWTRDKRIAEAFERAASFALAELEAFAAKRVRVGKDAWSRNTEKTGNILAATYRQYDSRAADPQLHLHCVVMNVTRGKDGRFFALETGDMCSHIRKGAYVRAVWFNALGKELQALGYKIERGEHGQIEIAGIRRDTLEILSKRSVEIRRGAEAELQRRAQVLRTASLLRVGDSNLRSWLSSQGERWADLSGKTLSNRERAVIARSSRSSKEESADLSVQHGFWQSELGIQRLNELEQVYQAALDRGPLVAEDETGAALAFAVEHLFERSSAIQRHVLLATAIEHHMGGIDVENAKKAVLSNLIPGKGEGLEQFLTTREQLDREKWCVSEVETRKDTVSPIDSEFRCAILRLGETWRPGFVSDDQARAIEGMLGTKDAVIALRGVAGAGKTTSLAVFNAAARSAGFQTLFLAPTVKAVDVLRTEGFEDAMTVAAFLADHRAQSEVDGQTVIVCDEAGMLSSRQGEGLLRVVSRSQARLVAVGDARQHSSVEAGDWLRILETQSRMTTFELTQIQRQKEHQYRSATTLMAKGQVRAGLEMLEEMGWIKETTSPETEIAGDFLKAWDAGVDHIAVAPTHAIIRAATAQIRDGLAERGVLSGPVRRFLVADSLNFTVAQKKNARSYTPGQLVTFNRRIPGASRNRAYAVEELKGNLLLLRAHSGARVAVDFQKYAHAYDVSLPREVELRNGDRIQIRSNDKKAGLANGDLLTFAGTHRAGGILTREGKTIPAGFLNFTHGYVVTSHKSQGRTAEEAGMIAGIDAKGIYVSATRAKKALRIYTPDKRALFASAERNGDRKAALEVTIDKTQRQKFMKKDTTATRGNPGSFPLANTRGNAFESRKVAGPDMTDIVRHMSQERERTLTALSPAARAAFDRIARTGEQELDIRLSRIQREARSELIQQRRMFAVHPELSSDPQARARFIETLRSAEGSSPQARRGHHPALEEMKRSGVAGEVPVRSPERNHDFHSL